MYIYFKLKYMCDVIIDIFEYFDFFCVKMCGKEIKNYKKIMVLYFKVFINNVFCVVL